MFEFTTATGHTVAVQINARPAVSCMALDPSGSWIPQTSPASQTAVFVTYGSDAIVVDIAAPEGANRLLASTLERSMQSVFANELPTRTVDHAVDEIRYLVRGLIGHAVTSFTDLRPLRPSILEDTAPAACTEHAGLTDEDRWADRFSLQSEDLTA